MDRYYILCGSLILHPPVNIINKKITFLIHLINDVYNHYFRLDTSFIQ